MLLSSVAGEIYHQVEPHRTRTLQEEYLTFRKAHDARCCCEMVFVLVLVLDFNIWVLKHRELRTLLFYVVHPNGANL
jgi:hypothetical protein